MHDAFHTRTETFSVRPFEGASTLEVRVRTALSGDTGPTLVALHGFGDTLETWGPLARALARSDTAPIGRFVALDLPGFGASTLPADMGEHYSTCAVELARAVAERFGVGPTFYVANSMGGSVALGALVRDARAGSGSVDGALLLAPATPETRTPIFVRLVRLRGYRILDEVGRRVGERGRRRIARAILRAFFKLVLAPGRAPDPTWARAVESALAREGAALDLEIVASELRAILRAERPEVEYLHTGASDVHVPIVIARGEHDRVIGRDELVELAARLPQGRYLELPDVGHVPQVEVPARVAELVTELVADSDVRRATSSGAGA